MVRNQRKKAKKKVEVKQEENQKYQDRLRIIRLKHEYIKCFVKGKYYLERCNMMIEQLNNEVVMETIDGCPKSFDLLRAEYYMTKASAVSLMREAAWNKQQLLDDFKLSEEELTAVHKEFLEKPIVRKAEDYDDSYKKERFASFVPTE